MMKHILEQYPEYEATIGIETHVQLKTNTKIFCGCPNTFGSLPNTNICVICTGQPGSLPMINEKVIEYAVKLGCATQSSIQASSVFARKHYFYPDLPKNYQITQDKTPICYDGHLTIKTEDGTEKKIRIGRIHMEEDAGKNIHKNFNESLVDLNRAGTPLLEIVTQPDIASAHQAAAYLQKLHALVRYLEISDANMEQGAFRGDINISVKKKTATELGTKVELKNLNSFKFITQAIDYEIERQITLLETGRGSEIIQETRLWDTKEHKTVHMRSKETAQDYHYFPDPDLPEIIITQDTIDSIQKTIPELADQRSARLQKEYLLSAYEADILCQERILADYYEATNTIAQDPKTTCNWILRDLLGYLKDSKTELTACNITPQHLGNLIILINNQTINNQAAAKVFSLMAETGAMPHVIIEKEGLKQIGSIEELEAIVDQIIAEQQEIVEAYRNGKDRLFGFFVGQAMKKTNGKGNPAIINDLLHKKLQR